ncbi:hypothetical protein [Pseudorhodoferax soli]|uniref:Uncharacterized protein n=1 Tax=Pseudorhodoferax soli TaxID=545864 RepID=A0A368XBR6_9BURK|nr:hypothetical protein [Pseudorhodoferax soli]RCW65159.1 hypothetical protein DES41_11383 [Pseudorhodoferax soli]
MPRAKSPEVDAVQVDANPRLRVTLDFRRSDDPLLFDALASLSKGRRRLARLRTLAHDGLAMDRGTRAPEPAPSASAVDAPGMRVSPSDDPEQLGELHPTLTSGLFDPPLDN